MDDGMDHTPKSQVYVTFSKILSLLWASMFSSVKECILTNLFLYLESYACKGLHLSNAYQNSLHVNLRILLDNWKKHTISDWFRVLSEINATIYIWFKQCQLRFFFFFMK